MKYYNCTNGKRHLLWNKENTLLRENSTKQKHVEKYINRTKDWNDKITWNTSPKVSTYKVVEKITHKVNAMMIQ